MKLCYETAPYIRKDEAKVSRMMLDVLIALSPVTIFACIQFGWKALVLILLSCITMISTEVLSVLIRYKKEKFKEKFTINNILTPAISGLIFALLLPTGGNFGMLCYATVICAFLGIFLSKIVFGGTGSNIFNPAAVTRIIAMVCFSSLFVYGVKATFSDFSTGATVLTTVNDAGIGAYKTALSNYSLVDLLIGNVPGTMGEVNALCIIAGAVYLIVRKSCDYRPMVSMIVFFALIMLFVGLFYRGFVDSSFNPFEFMIFEVLSGGLLFGAVFMITDPVTSPITKGGRILYGCLAATITAILRLCSGLPEGVAYSILIVNALAPLIDYYKWSKPKYTFNLFAGLAILLASVIAICSASIIKDDFQKVAGLVFFICIVVAIIALVLFNWLRKRGAKKNG